MLPPGAASASATPAKMVEAIIETPGRRIVSLGKSVNLGGHCYCTTRKTKSPVTVTLSLGIILLTSDHAVDRICSGRSIVMLDSTKSGVRR